MKLLKDEIRSAIIDSAKKEFLLNGYKNSSMRVIAKEAKITVGNIYKYFENKDSLFSCILDPVYNELKHLIMHHDDNLKDIDKTSIDRLIEEQTAVVLNLLKNHRIELLILIDSSDGSKYEGVKKYLVSLLSEGTKEHLLQYYNFNKDNNIINEININDLALAIAQSFLEGFFTLIRNNENPQEIEQSGKEFVKFFFSGFKEIL